MHKKKIREVCIVRNTAIVTFIKKLIEEMKKTNNKCGSRIIFFNGVQKIDDKDNRRVLLNGFHLFLSSGLAGINRMSNNIKNNFMSLHWIMM